MLVGCTNPDCEEWLHYECLLHDVLTRVYEKLGTVAPHKLGEPPVEMKVKAQLPATPRSTTPEVKDDKQWTPTVIPSEARDSVHPKRSDVITPSTTMSPTPGMSAPAAKQPSRSPPTQKCHPKKVVGRKPYEGLFEAALQLDNGPTVWQITDLRNGSGSDDTWTERAQCLVCRSEIE